MTNKSITALTAATTPLAGTEALPVAQSGYRVRCWGWCLFNLQLGCSVLRRNNDTYRRYFHILHIRNKMSLTKVAYSMVQGAPINVLDYGAIGDGITDNYLA